MSKLLVVFGATGNQGGSVVDFVLNDPELSKQYKIRGTTRDASKPAAEALKSKGVEMVSCNLNESTSVASALEGAHTIFMMTASEYSVNGGTGRDSEYKQGKAVADAAVTSRASYLIFSTLPSISKTSGGELTRGWAFDVKYDIEQYIRTLKIKSAFFAPGSFMQNIQTAYKPRKQEDGTYAIAGIEDPANPRTPMIDILDTGKYVAAILSEPDKYQGKIIAGAEGIYSWNHVCDVLSRVTGKTVKYKVLPEAVWASFIPEDRVGALVDMVKNRNTYGYYGAESEELVAWSNEQAKGKLTTIEEYLAKNPLEL